MKQHYFMKLIPPRPTFPFDMSDAERALMQQHLEYFWVHFQAGKVLLYGPVMDPDGAFGMGVLEVEDEQEARAIADNDPTILARLNTYALFPMRVGGAQSGSLEAEILR